MKTLVLIFLVAITICFVFSCSRSSSCVSSGGGRGGTGKISVTPTHLNLYIDSCTVYIKYGTLDAPADGIYDDSQKCILPVGDTIPVAIFDSLKPGIYYIYGNGYHVGYNPPYVIGGIPYTLCSATSQSIYLPTYSYWP